MCVSSELGQKGRDLKQWADDKVDDKSTVLPTLCLGVSPCLRLASFLCHCAVSQGCPAWSDLLTSGRKIPGEALGSTMNLIQGLDTLVHKGILFCEFKAELREGTFWTLTWSHSQSHL